MYRVGLLVPCCNTDQRSRLLLLQNDQMNRVLYALTLVTTTFIPAQFLTGVYGMNFDVRELAVAP